MNYSQTYNFQSSRDVLAANSIPHFIVHPFVNDTQVGLTEGSFYVNFSNRDATLDYIQSIVIFPLALFIISVFVLIIVQIVSLSRYACGNSSLSCCRAEENQHALSSIKIAYIAFTTTALVALSFVFLGNTWMNDGIETSIMGLNAMSILFEDLSYLGVVLNQTGQEIYVLSNDIISNCCILNDCTAYSKSTNNVASSLKSVGGIIYSEATGFSQKLDMLSDRFYEHGVVQKNIVLYSFYALVAFLLLLLFIAAFIDRKGYLQMLVFLSNLYIIFLLTISCSLMVPVVTITINRITHNTYTSVSTYKYS